MLINKAFKKGFPDDETKSKFLPSYHYNLKRNNEFESKWKIQLTLNLNVKIYSHSLNIRNW